MPKVSSRWQTGVYEKFYGNQEIGVVKDESLTEKFDDAVLEKRRAVALTILWGGVSA